MHLQEVFWQSECGLLIKTPSSHPPQLELGYFETQKPSPVEQASREYRGLHLFRVGLEGFVFERTGVTSPVSVLPTSLMRAVALVC